MSEREFQISVGISNLPYNKTSDDNKFESSDQSCQHTYPESPNPIRRKIDL